MKDDHENKETYKMTDALTSLIEQHKKDIWEFKQKESQWIKDQSLLAGSKQIIEGISAKMVEMGKTNLAHQQLNGKLQLRLTEVEEDNKKLAKQIEHLNSRLSK